MSPSTITEIRRELCMALSDMGAVSERLRDLEDPDMSPAVEADSIEEISDWLAQAQGALNRAGLLATNGK